MLKPTDSNFSELIAPELRDITSKTFCDPNWRTLGKMLIDFADSLDTSALTADALAKEAKSLKAWVAVDSHNWSDYSKARVQNQIHLMEYLARKLDN